MKKTIQENTKHTLLLIILLAFTCVIAASCKDKNEDQEETTPTPKPYATELDMSPAICASSLSKKLTFTEGLTSVDAGAIAEIFDLPDYTDVAMMTTTSSSEQIIVFRTRKINDLKGIVAMVKDYLSNKKEALTDKTSKDYSRLDNTVIITNSNYAIIVVSDYPNTAKNTINKLMAGYSISD